MFTHGAAPARCMWTRGCQGGMAVWELHTLTNSTSITWPTRFTHKSAHHHSCSEGPRVEIPKFWSTHKVLGKGTRIQSLESGICQNFCWIVRVSNCACPFALWKQRMFYMEFCFVTCACRFQQNFIRIIYTEVSAVQGVWSTDLYMVRAKPSQYIPCPSIKTAVYYSSAPNGRVETWIQDFGPLVVCSFSSESGCFDTCEIPEWQEQWTSKSVDCQLGDALREHRKDSNTEFART